MKDYQEDTLPERNSHAFRDGRVYKQAKRQQCALLQPFRNNIKHTGDNDMPDFEAPGLAELVVKQRNSSSSSGFFIEVLEWYRKLSPGYLVGGQIEWEVYLLLREEYHRLCPALKQEINERIQVRKAHVEQLEMFAKTMNRD